MAGFHHEGQPERRSTNYQALLRAVARPHSKAVVVTPSRAATAVVVDRHPAVVSAIEAWFAAADPPIRVIAGGSLFEVAWTMPGDSADLVVLEPLRSDSGAVAYGELRRLVNAGRRVVVYTACEDRQVASNCVDLGATAVLTKSASRGQLVATAAIVCGRDEAAVASLGTAAMADTELARPRLSERELQVLTEWFRSDSKERTARLIGIGVHTVNTYIDRVRLKYANVGRPARTKATLLARAIQDGLVRPDDL